MRKARFKQMYADLSLKHEALKDIVEKKTLKPAANRELVDHAQQAYGISQRAACEVLNLSRSVYRYRPDGNRDRRHPGRTGNPSRLQLWEIV